MATPFTKVSQRIPPIDYTSRDFESISQDMQRAIPFFAPEWTDHNLSDFGIVLQRLLAFVGDVLHFYLDRAANEAFLPTAITRRSVINLLKLIDFELRSAVAATVDIQCSIQNTLPGDLLIPAGTELQTTADATETPIFFETIRDAVIVAGNLTVMVAAIEGQTKTEDVGVSTGVARQRFDLLGKPIIDGSLQIFIDEGIGEELWTEVDNFIFSDATSKHFTSQRDEENNVTIFFGDNAQGKIPDSAATIRAAYRVGGGLQGNVASDTITAVNDTFTFNSQPVTVAVTNPNPASGGEDEMSIDEAKVLGPQSLHALNRAVTPNDFVALAEGFPGVAKASVVVGGSMVDPIAGCCCQITLFISPRGGGPPSSELKADLLAYFEDRKMIGTCIQIGEPEYSPVDVIGTVHMAANFATDAVTADTLNSIDAFFEGTSDFIGFGQPVFLSDFMHLMDAVPGVDHVDLTDLTLQPVPKYEVWSGDCTLGGFIIGEESKEEEWTIIFMSLTTFSVRGTVSGLQAAIGTIGLPYLSGGGEIGFTISCGVGPPPNIADRAKFTTSKKFANVPIKANQVAMKGLVSLTFVGGGRSQTDCP
jgi:hypothetical protein